MNLFLLTSCSNTHPLLELRYCTLDPYKANSPTQLTNHNKALQASGCSSLPGPMPASTSNLAKGTAHWFWAKNLLVYLGYKLYSKFMVHLVPLIAHNFLKQKKLYIIENTKNRGKKQKWRRKLEVYKSCCTYYGKVMMQAKYISLKITIFIRWLLFLSAVICIWWFSDEWLEVGFKVACRRTSTYGHSKAVQIAHLMLDLSMGCNETYQLSHELMLAGIESSWSNKITARHGTWGELITPKLW